MFIVHSTCYQCVVHGARVVREWMGFLDLLKGTDINTEVEKYKTMKEAVLLDVRSADEYKC